MIPSIFHDPASHRVARERQRVRYFPSRVDWMYGTNSVLPQAMPRWADKQTSLIVGPFGSSNVRTGESLAPHRGDEYRSTHIPTKRESERQERFLQTTYLPCANQVLTEKPTTWAGTHAQGKLLASAAVPPPPHSHRTSIKATASYDGKAGLVGTSWTCGPLRHCSQLPAKASSWRPCRDGELRCAIFLGFVLARLSRAGRESSLARAADLGEGGLFWWTSSLSVCMFLYVFSLCVFFFVFLRVGLLSMVGLPYGIHCRLGGGRRGPLLSQITTLPFITHNKASMDVPSSLLTHSAYSTLPTRE